MVGQINGNHCANVTTKAELKDELKPWDPAVKDECKWGPDCVEDRYGKYMFNTFKEWVLHFFILWSLLSYFKDKAKENIGHHTRSNWKYTSGQTQQNSSRIRAEMQRL